MITVIYSTKEPKPDYRKHIKETIGVEGYEIVEVVNNTNKDSKYFNGGESLTSLYKRELQNSKYDIVALIHDDLIFETKGWGNILIKQFEDTDFGVLGAAGSAQMIEDGTWWNNTKELAGIVNHKVDGKQWESKFSMDFGDKIANVVAIDGLFMAVNKKKLKYEFSEDVKGFHYYDVDFSFGNHVNGCKVGIIFNIRITHLSTGNANEKWRRNRNNFINKWGDYLPIMADINLNLPTKITHLINIPKISLIIKGGENVEMISNCLSSIRNNSDYNNIEIIVSYNNLNVKTLKNISTEFNNVKFIKTNENNKSKILNDIVNNNIGEDVELLLFMSEGIELINDAISQMVNYYNVNKYNVGTIGARLHYPNKRVYHSGIFGVFNSANNHLSFSNVGKGTVYNYTETKPVIASTGLMLMINKELFNSVGQFNENYIQSFEDIELSLSCIVAKKENIYVSEAICYYNIADKILNNEIINKMNLDYRNNLGPFVMKNIETHKYIQQA